MRRLSWIAGGLAMVPGAALGCALELIMAVDVSGSVDEREFTLQTEGMAAAFEHPSMIRAIEAQEGGVLATVTQWSGRQRHKQVTGWFLMEGPADMAAFATAIRQSGRDWRNYSTAVGEALIHAGEVGATAPHACKRKVIDVSGDGVSNEGAAPRPIANQLAAQGYTINGLVIRGDSPDPVAFYEREVLAGERSFIEVARNFDDYPRAILKKLLREIEDYALVSDAR